MDVSKCTRKIGGVWYILSSEIVQKMMKDHKEPLTYEFKKTVWKIKLAFNTGLCDSVPR